MKRVLLISNKVMHYRSRIYNAFYDMFLKKGYEFHVASNEFQKVDIPIRYKKHEIPFSIVKYKSLIKEIHPDVCINFLHLKDHMIIPLTLYCKWHKIPMIYWGHGVNLNDSNNKIKAILFNIIHTISSSLIIYSKEQLKFISKRNRAKTFIANNTLDFSDVNMASIRPKEQVKKIYGIKEDNILMYISRILPYKGLDILLDKFKNDRNIGLVIVGAGLNDIQKNIIEKIDHFYYLGEKYGMEVDEIYNMGDIFSTPGHIGLAVNQAMYWGKPIVVLNRRHAPEIIYLKNGVNGFIVDGEDKLHECILKIFNDKELYKQLSENARYTYEHEMKIEHMFSGFMDAIDYCNQAK